MTLGIATILPDSIVMIADGRERYLIKDEIVTDAKNKIINVRNDFALIPTGVSEITEFAVKWLNLNYKSHLTIEQICKLVDQSLKVAWQKKVSDLPEDIDLDNPKIHSTFLVGGIIDGQSFITGISRNHNSKQPYFIAKDSIQYLIVGSSQTEAENFYKRELDKHLEEDKIWNDLKDLQKQIVNCGANTIRAMEKIDFLIGGTIRYLILQPDGSFNTSVIEK